MLPFPDYRDLPFSATGAVVALGNFDGVHKGHAAIIAVARREAARLNARLGVLTFEPHPRAVFHPDAPPFRLTTQAAKARLLAELGVDALYIAPFTPEFSRLTAPEFEQAVLAGGVKPAALVAGEDFRYGHSRTGDFTSLAAFGAAHGLPVIAAPTLADAEGQPYSSTRIRRALAEAKPEDAAALLGRDWEIDYVVERGDRRGRTLGFPTANGRLGELLRPAYGIYAVRVAIAGRAEAYKGVASIGIRPMWRTDEPLIETHLFDFDEEIYGEEIRVALARFQRPELKFDDIEGLKNQMTLDCALARAMMEINK